MPLCTCNMCLDVPPGMLRPVYTSNGLAATDPVSNRLLSGYAIPGSSDIRLADGRICDSEGRIYDQVSNPPFDNVPEYTGAVDTLLLRNLFVGAEEPDVWASASYATTNTQQTETVGSTNLEEQGVEMPVRNRGSIEVPLSPYSRARYFERANLRDTLLENPSEESWLATLREYQSVDTVATWNYTEGETYGPEPIYQLGGREYVETLITIEKLSEYLLTVTGGKLSATLVDDDGSGRPGYRAQLATPLENEAYQLFNNTTYRLARAVDNGPQEWVQVSNAFAMLDYYFSFARTYRREYIRKALRERMKSPAKTIKQTENWTEERMKKFEEFIRNFKAQLQPEYDSFRHLPILPRKTLSSRTWGIEIEAVNIDGIDTPDGWILKGDGSLRDLSQVNMPPRGDDPRFSEDAFNGRISTGIPVEQWPNANGEHHEDCDISYADRNEYDEDDYECTCYEYNELDDRDPLAQVLTRHPFRTIVGEWNSPVLRSFHSRGLQHLTSELETRNTNDSAGIHVHVGASDLTPDAVGRLSLIYSALEPLFRNEYRRGSDRQYCHEVAPYEIIQRFKNMRDLKNRSGNVMQGRYGDRYRTLNLSSLPSHGTVEFRAMGPYYNYEHLIRWAYFARELVNVANSNVQQKDWANVRTMRDVVVLFSKFGKETPTPEWASNVLNKDADKVVELLGSETRRKPHTQPLEMNPNIGVQNDDYDSSDTHMTTNYRYSERAGVTRVREEAVAVTINIPNLASLRW